jgi:hypothetical protein
MHQHTKLILVIIRKLNLCRCTIIHPPILVSLFPRAQSRATLIKSNRQVLVDETLPVNETLPNLTLCAANIDTNADGLDLSIIRGDEQNYFRPVQLNNTCWALLVVKQLDADVRLSIHIYKLEIISGPLWPNIPADTETIRSN